MFGVPATMLIISHLLLMWWFLLQPSAVNSECIWYGQCNVGQDNKIHNCFYNGTAKRTADERSIQILKKWCPHFPINEDHSADTCCDVHQLETLEENVDILKMFLGRCSSCFQNVLNIFCDLTCSADQSNFINVTGTDHGINGTFITSIDFYIMREYGQRMYDSCKGVFVPSANTLALDMLCGSWGASRCYLDRWFEYLGSSKKNPYVPFDINYIWSSNVSSSTYTPLNLTAVPCHESLNNVTTKCSCLDCEKSCPAITFRQDNSIDRHDVTAVIGGILIFILISITLYAVWFLLPDEKVDDENPPDENQDLKQPAENDDNFVPILRFSDGSQDDPSPQINYETEEPLLFTSHFRSLGEFCGRNPYAVILISFMVVIGFSSGLYYLKFLTDPIELGASKASLCKPEREYYNEHFKPFYRIQQVIIKPVGLDNVVHNSSTGMKKFGPVFNKNFLLEVKSLQDKIMNLEESGIKLQHLCYAPLMPSTNKQPSKASKCLVQSIWGYYQNDLRIFNRTRLDDDNYTVNYLDHFIACSRNSFNPICLGKYGGPINPAIAMGGFLPLTYMGEKILLDNPPYEWATSVILTFLLNNHYHKEDLLPVLSWEKRFISFMQNWISAEKPKFMDVSFYSESSIEGEVDRGATAATFVVTLSYILMFCYVIFFLEPHSSCKSFLINSRTTVGLLGILIILASVTSSIGLNSIFGVRVTLINLQVVPFFVLTMGVNKMFILTSSYKKIVLDEIYENRVLDKCMGEVLASVGPSMLLSCVGESLCFVSAYLVEIPSIQSFALIAGVAVIINFILMTTCFVSILVLDMERSMKRKLDVLCCIRHSNDDPVSELNDRIYNLFLNAYKYLWLINVPRFLIIIGFVGWFSFSLCLISRIDIGLNPEITVSKDSYLIKYFRDIRNELEIGPPVYFVVDGDLNVSDTYVQNIICGGQYCNSDSIVNQIYNGYRRDKRKFLASPSTSWIDDYIDWSANEGCCRSNPANDSFCPHDDMLCNLCDIKLNSINRPLSSDFDKFLTYFLEDNPTPLCAKGGHAAYSEAVKFHYDKSHHQLKVNASTFMTYHTPLRTSEDYLNALQEARILADNMTVTIRHYLGKNNTARVFPYSIFYVYYEQYLHIWSDTMLTCGICSLIIAVSVYIFKNFDIVFTVVILIGTSMTFVNLITFMYFFNVQLNALTLINILTCIGMSIEFSSYLVLKKKWVDSHEIINTLANTAFCVFLGPICLNKIGLLVLGFSNSSLIDVVYFRTYLLIITMNTIHFLVFIPAVLIQLGHWRIRRVMSKKRNDK